MRRVIVALNAGGGGEAALQLCRLGTEWFVDFYLGPALRLEFFHRWSYMLEAPLETYRVYFFMDQGALQTVPYAAVRTWVVADEDIYYEKLISIIEIGVIDLKVVVQNGMSYLEFDQIMFDDLPDAPRKYTYRTVLGPARS